MDLRVRTRTVNGATVVGVAGEVELHSARQLRAELLQACSGECPCVVVDLSAVSFIDSSGIGVIVGALKRARERGGSLVLVSPQPRVRRIFEITGLLGALPFYDAIDGAIAACTRGTQQATTQQPTNDIPTGNPAEEKAK